MIRRLYINNFRCLENFSLAPDGESSVLLIGKNGTGKSSVWKALEILQKAARGTNRVRDLLTPKDFGEGKSDSPIRIEIEVEIQSKRFTYSLAFELPDTFRELRIFEESLIVDGAWYFRRELAQVTLPRAGTSQGSLANFGVDWHLVALPIVQEISQQDPLSIFKTWLSRIILLQPIPQIINGLSTDATLVPEVSASNLGDWFSGLLAHAPSAYYTIDQYLRPIFPDLKDIKNPAIGPDSRSIEIQFEVNGKSVHLPFARLSDGEKCLMICSLVVAANAAYGPLLCFWDEPENHIGLSEVGYLMTALRKTFGKGGQLIATSHNPEAIRAFSDMNTFVLQRKSHLEPTDIRRLSEFQVQGDLVDALIRGDVGE